MTKKQQLIQLIKAKSREGDIKGAMRIYIENKCISYATYQGAMYISISKETK